MCLELSARVAPFLWQRNECTTGHVCTGLRRLRIAATTSHGPTGVYHLELPLTRPHAIMFETQGAHAIDPERLRGRGQMSSHLPMSCWQPILCSSRYSATLREPIEHVEDAREGSPGEHCMCFKTSKCVRLSQGSADIHSKVSSNQQRCWHRAFSRALVSAGRQSASRNQTLSEPDRRRKEA